MPRMADLFPYALPGSRLAVHVGIVPVMRIVVDTVAALIHASRLCYGTELLRTTLYDPAYPSMEEPCLAEC
jgi:hypothetical protein